MNLNRVIYVLAAVVVLLSIIFIIEVNQKRNPTSSVKIEQENIINKENETINNNNVITQNINSIYKVEDNNSTTKKLLAENNNKINPKNTTIYWGLGIYIFLIFISLYKLCRKVEVNIIFIILHIIATIVSIILLVKASNALSSINFQTYYKNMTTAIWIIEIASVILAMVLYQKVGFTLWWLLPLIFIPKIGGIIGLILYVLAMCTLGEYFNKSTGYKIGLIFLGFIYIADLAFRKE